jgi:dipeptidyl aminopeptidase/acylaminoacyl peptidase
MLPYHSVVIRPFAMQYLLRVGVSMYTVLRNATCLLTLILVGAASAASAAEKVRAPLPLDLVASGAKTVRSRIQYSPDGRWVAFVESESESFPWSRTPYSSTGIPEFGGARTQVVVVDTRTHKSFSVAGSKSWSWAPSWSPDSRRLAFYSDEGGEIQIWIWQIGVARAEPIAGLIPRPNERYGDQILWTSDGQHLLCKVLPEHMTLAEANARSPTQAQSNPLQPPVDFKATPADTASVYVYDSHAPSDPVSRGRAQGHPDTKSAAADLVVIDLQGRISRRISSDSQERWYAFSPDEHQIAVSTFSDWDVNAYQAKYELALYDLTTGVRKSLASDLRIAPGRPCSWSPNGLYVACVLAQYEGDSIGFPLATNQLVVFSVADGTRKTIASNVQVITSYPAGGLWDSSSSSLYVVGTDEKPSKSLTWYWNKRDRLWRADIVSSQATVLTDIPGQQVTSMISADERTPWTTRKDRSAWIFTRTLGGRTTMSGPASLYRINLTTGQVHKAMQMNTGWASYSGASTAAGTIAYSATTLQTPQDVWVFDTEHNTSSRLTKLNPRWNRYSLGTGRILQYQDVEGRDLHAGLLLPPGYRHDHKLPLIVFAFGYPIDSTMINSFGVYGYYPSYNMHVLATRGYAVLNPDMPLRPGTQMQDVAASVLPAVNAAIDQGYVDPNRLGVLGYCIGSYTAVALALQSDRFKAVAIGGVTVVPDLVSSYLYADPLSDNPKAYDDQADRLAMGVTPWEHPDYFVNNSAAVSYDKLHTPLLLGQGSADGLFVSNVIYGALKRLKKDVEYRVYENEDHEISRAPNVIDFWQRRIDFYDQHLDVARDEQGRMLFEGEHAKSRQPGGPASLHAQSLQLRDVHLK